MLPAGPREALVVGSFNGHTWPLPHLLWRAGFSVDLIAPSHFLRASKFVRRLRRVDSIHDLAPAAVEQICARERPYDWVIAADDFVLKKLGGMDWPEGASPRFLSQKRQGGIDHLFSKIGLSRALEAGGIRTPPFEVAASWQEAAEWAEGQGYPVLLKVDASGGGYGVYECNCEAEMEQLGGLFRSGAVLVQKKIEGRELDLSGIYFDRQLVHFSYARVEKVQRRFGPSILRTYYPLPLVGAEIFAELTRLGEALGANGFATIACIEAADGSGRYYIEADMRPNVWVDYAVFFGEDPAERIRNWFSSGTRLTAQNAESRGQCEPVEIPYFLRMRLWELMMNRYRVWEYIPFTDTGLVLKLLARTCIVDAAKTVLPRGLHQRVRDAAFRTRLQSAWP